MADEELSESKIKQIQECVGFFGVENAATMCNLSVETINQLMAGESIAKSAEKRKTERSADRSADRSAEESAADPPSTSQANHQSRSEKSERSSSRSPPRSPPRSPKRSPKRSCADVRYSAYSSKPDSSSSNKRKQKDRDRSPYASSSFKRSPPSTRRSRSQSPARSGWQSSKRPHRSKDQYSDIRLENRANTRIETRTHTHMEISISDEDDPANEEGEFGAVSGEASEGRWVSSYMHGAEEAAKSTDDPRDRLANNYVFNAFQTLLKAKKTFIDTEQVVAIFVCSLMSSAQDIFLYPSHKSSGEEQAAAKTAFLNTSLCLAITANGCKFRPAFLLNHVKLNGRSLVEHRAVAHVQTRREWLETVLKPEMETNMIYSAVCLTENEDLYLDEETGCLFDQLNCELIVVPNSLATHLSPFQHSILLALNGILHDLYLKSNKKFPTSLSDSLKFFEQAWGRLSADEIRNAFNSTILKALCSD